jgi:hypothetical protein
MRILIQMAMLHTMHVNSVLITREMAAEQDLARRSAVPNR